MALPTPDRRAAGRLLAASVNHLCSLDDGGSCATGKPAVPFREPLPVGSAPAILSVLDLPPVGKVKQPWVGTEPRKAVTNDASSAARSHHTLATAVSSARVRCSATRSGRSFACSGR